MRRLYQKHLKFPSEADNGLDIDFVRLRLFRDTLMAIGRDIFPKGFESREVDSEVVVTRINERLRPEQQRFEADEAGAALEALHRLDIVHYQNGTVLPLDTEVQ